MQPHDHTRCSPTARHVSAWCMLAIFAGFAVSAGISLWRGADKPLELPEEGTRAFIDGKAASAFESWFNDALIWEPQATGTWGALRYALFNTGNDGVVIGRDGWFFSREEFEIPANYEEIYATNLQHITTAAALLKDKGSRVIIVPVPSKARLYDRYLPDGVVVPEPRRNLYAQFAKDLRARDIEVVPLVQAMENEERTHGLRSFLKTDTHWTPQGAALVAQVVADYLRDATYERSVTASTPDEPKVLEDADLLRFVPTGWFGRYIGPHKELVSQRHYSAGSAASGGDLFGEVSIPFALVGTSYSAIETWQFVDALKAALGADVLNLADEGQGPLEPMQGYVYRVLEGESDAAPYVLWEIPERFLFTDYKGIDFEGKGC